MVSVLYSFGRSREMPENTTPSEGVQGYKTIVTRPSQDISLKKTRPSHRFAAGPSL